MPISARLPLLASVIFVAMTSVNWSPEDAGIALTDPEILQHHGTAMSPLLDQPIPAGQNFLWCATFQMAWDAACKNLGGPIQLLPASKFADSLNHARFNSNWIDGDSVFTAEGYVADGVLEKVRNKKGSPSKLLDQLEKSSSMEDLIFYSALEKDLKFAQPFANLGSWKVGRRSVPWFGFTPEQKNTEPLLKQVRVHHYRSKDDFVIELSTSNTGDQLLLAKLPQAPKSPGSIGTSMLGHLQPNPPQALANDLLAIPNIAATQSMRFSQIEGRKLKGSVKILRLAWQTIDFRMDEKGAKLRSEAAVSFGCSASPDITPRLMVLNPPFALIMTRKGSPKPYFIAWFANADLLTGK